jgi:hypothetical protein
MADRRRTSGRRPLSDVHDQVPDEVVKQAKGAFQRRTGGELAVLVYDSLVDERAPEAEHRLRFEHPHEHVEVIVSRTNGECTLRGRVDRAPVRIELEMEGTDVALVEEAADGEFAFGSVPHGLKRIVLIAPDGTDPVRTDWFRT